MKVSKLHSVLFLFLVVLAVYFPAINAVVNTVDDVHIINAYGINGQRTLSQILLPGNQFYFRPFIELTYYLDNLLWALDPRMMHLENVLLHALNALIVYHIAARAASLSGGSPSLPFVSSLFFAIHPINTEAVNWIAGRTDLLSAFFILFSILFLLKSIQSGDTKDYYCAFAAMLVSFLAKETSIMLIPASILIIFYVDNCKSNVSAASMRMRHLMTVHYCVLAVMLIGYVAVRLFLKPTGSVNAFSMLFQQRFDFTALLSEFIVVTGYYAKKLFIPFPLNFAIHTVSEWYSAVGIAVVVAAVYLVRKKRIITSLLVICLLFIFPAVIVKLSGLTWTPVAERYLYIPAAFFSIGLSGIIVSVAPRLKHDKFVCSVAAIVALIIATLTFNRNLVWKDNLTLFQDAVDKSPNFGDIHNELGIALAKKGNFQEARNHFMLAEKLSGRTVIRELAQMNMLNCDLQGKTIFEKNKIIEHHIAANINVHPEMLKILRDIKMVFLQTEGSKVKQALLVNEAIELNDKIFRKVKDPVYLYNNGKLKLTLGDKSAALDYFRKTVAIATSDVFYFKAAKKLINDLEK